MEAEKTYFAFALSRTVELVLGLSSSEVVAGRCVALRPELFQGLMKAGVPCMDKVVRAQGTVCFESKSDRISKGHMAVEFDTTGKCGVSDNLFRGRFLASRDEDFLNPDKRRQFYEWEEPLGANGAREEGVGGSN